MMKKAIFILLCLASSMIAISQNFQVIPNEGCYFFDNNVYPKSYEFDESKVVDNGMMYYPYQSGLRIFLEEGWIINPNTSLLGDSVLIGENGCTIFNSYNYAFYFKRFVDPIPWIVLTETNGAYIEGRYTSISSGEILPGLTDTYAFMHLNVYDSMGILMEDHPLNEFELKVSANYGAVNLFSINNFKGIYYDDYGSNSFRLYQLTSFIKDDYVHGYSPDFSGLLTSLDVGLETHTTWGDYDYSYEVKRQLTNKMYNDPYISYVFKDCIHRYSYNSDTIYSEDTLITFNYRMRMNEIFDSLDASGKSGFLYTRNYSTGDETSLFKPYFTYTKYYKRSEYEWNQLLVWGIQADIGYSMGIDGSHKFIDGLGDFMPYRGESGTREELVYYKTPYDEWGTPLEFSCPNTGLAENQQFDIRIFPMPAEEVIQIQSPLKIDRIQFYDLQGRLVKTEDLNGQTSLDVSSMEKGVYLIEIYSETKLLDYQKIMIQ